jgi:hypothetical protein
MESMIITQNITISGRALIRTYADAGMLIERDGARYAEAIDPAELGRTYTETDEPIYEEELSAEEALEIITGGTV